MTDIIIKNCTFADVSEAYNWPLLIEEYGEEGKIEGVPNNVQLSFYRNAELANILFTIGVFLNEELIGFALLLSVILPHHGIKASIVDAIFITKEHRKNNNGLNLIKACENLAKTIGTLGIVFNTPFEGPLTDVLFAKKYKETGRVLLRKFADE